MPRETLAPDAERGCDSCGIENLLLHRVEPPSFSKNRDESWFCDFCYSTFAGNTVQYPENYRENGEIMRHVCAVANILLKKLEEGKHAKP